MDHAPRSALPAVLLLAAALPAQALAPSVAAADAGGCICVRGADAGVRASGPRPFAGRGRDLCFDQLPAGDYELHFAAGGGGKPASLPLPLPAGATAEVAVGAATAELPPPRAVAFASDLAGWTAVGDGGAWLPQDGRVRRQPGAGAAALVTGDPQQRGQRVACDVGEADGPAGIVLRWQGPGDGYRCVLDPAAGEVRLERLLGGSLFVLGRHAVRGGAHRLAAQADGFRVACWCDDAPMVQVLDGALTHGRAGVTAAAAAVFAGFALGEPLPPRAVLAAVREADGAVEVQVRGRLPQHVGRDYVLALRLLPPPGPRLYRESGLEPFLLLGDPPAVLPPGSCWGGRWHDLRGSIGPAGELRASLQWPSRRPFAGQWLRLGGFVVSADGEQVVDRLPEVWLQL